MISWQKEYYFKPDTLELKASPTSFRKVLYKAGRFILVNSITAGLLLFVYIHYFNTPRNIIRQKQIETLLYKYDSLDAKIKHHKQILLASLNSSDKIYREVLGLDSLPVSVRSAGIGGTAINEDIANTNNYSVKQSVLRQFLNLSSQINLQKESFDIIEQRALLYNHKLSCIPGIQPINPETNTWISSYFGGRSDPFTNLFSSHKGIDFVGPVDTKIFATADGIVTLAEYSRTGYGNEIVINHGFGFSTRYAHLNKILVKEGDTIHRGKLIGLMGNTGRSTGTHLHYEVRLNNRAIDPLLFFEDDLTPEEYALITNAKKTDTN